MQFHYTFREKKEVFMWITIFMEHKVTKLGKIQAHINIYKQIIYIANQCSVYIQLLWNYDPFFWRTKFTCIGLHIVIFKKYFEEF